MALLPVVVVPFVTVGVGQVTPLLSRLVQPPNFVVPEVSAVSRPCGRTNWSPSDCSKSGGCAMRQAPWRLEDELVVRSPFVGDKGKCIDHAARPEHGFLELLRGVAIALGQLTASLKLVLEELLAVMHPCSRKHHHKPRAPWAPQATQSRVGPMAAASCSAFGRE